MSRRPCLTTSAIPADPAITSASPGSISTTANAASRALIRLLGGPLHLAEPARRELAEDLHVVVDLDVRQIVEVARDDIGRQRLEVLPGHRDLGLVEPQAADRAVVDDQQLVAGLVVTVAVDRGVRRLGRGGDAP